MKDLLPSLWIKLQPLLLAWATALLRQYVGFGKKLWAEFNDEIDSLDKNSTLTPTDRHQLAVAWLREKLVLPEDQSMPHFYLRADWEGRAVQLAVLIRRLQAWICPNAQPQI